jgi:hypothetical protein
MRININSTTAYFDHVVILSRYSRRDLIKRFANIDFNDYCLNQPDDHPIREASNSAKYHDYIGKIDLKVVKDEFFALLTDERVGECTISRIEIARDFECLCKSDPGKLKFAFLHNSYCKWKRRAFDYTGKKSSTDYIGKAHGIKSANYISCYVPPDGSKITGMPVFHLEFVLLNWAKIKETLQITHPSHCPPAEEIFSRLEQRFISFPTINSKKLYKAIFEVGRNREAARRSVENTRTFFALKERIKESKDHLRQRIMCQRLNKSMRGNSLLPGRPFNIPSRRHKVLDWKAIHFLNSSPRPCNNISTFFNSYFK